MCMLKRGACRYFVELLQEYAKLQAFQPKVGVWLESKLTSSDGGVAARCSC